MIWASDVSWQRFRSHLPSRVIAVIGQLGWVLGGTVLVAASTLLCYKAIASSGSTASLRQYAEVRRYLGVVSPILACGLAVTVPAAVGVRLTMGEATSVVRRQATISFIVAGVALIFCLSIMNRFDEVPAAGIVGASVLAGSALSVTGVLFAFYRAQSRYARGASLNLVSNGVYPLLAVVCAPANMMFIAIIWSALVVVTAAIALPPTHEDAVAEVRLRKILRSSGRRIPGDLSLVLLMLTPIILLTGQDDAESAVLIYGITLLSLLIMAVTPLAVVGLPWIARSSRDELMHTWPIYLTILISGLALAGACALVLINWSSTIISVFLDARYAGYDWIISGLWPCLAAAVLFGVVRVLADGLMEKPVVPHFCLVGLFGMAAALSFGGISIRSVQLALNVGFCLLTAGVVGCVVVHLIRKVAA